MTSRRTPGSNPRPASYGSGLNSGWSSRRGQVPSGCLRATWTRLTGVPIEDVESPALLALVWMPGEGPALHEFLAHCRQAVARPLAGQRP